MRTNAIQNNEHRSIFVPAAQGAAVGTAAGWAGKYILPLTYEEKNSDEYVKVKNRINDQKMTFSFRTQKYIDSLIAKDSHSVAEDEFIKMFDGMKDGEKMKLSKIRTAINNITQKKPGELLDFKRICKNSSKVAEKTAKRFMNAYDLTTKHLRPAGFFLAAGALTGAGVALANDILKVRVED